MRPRCPRYITVYTLHYYMITHHRRTLGWRWVSAKRGGGYAARSSRGSVSRALELEPCKAAKIPKRSSITPFGMINVRSCKPPWSSWRLCNLLRRFGANLESPPATRRIELGQSSPLSSSAPCPRLPRFGKRALCLDPPSFLPIVAWRSVRHFRPSLRERVDTESHARVRNAESTHGLL